jgi:hypothetical protein
MSALITIVIISLFCNGIYLITRQGMILHPLNRWVINKLGGVEHSDGSVAFLYNSLFYFKCTMLYKPLFGCITCMSSIWGSAAYWTISDSLSFYPVAIIGAACVNLIINQIYDKE